jgi:GT2 family glycosyltransferase
MNRDSSAVASEPRGVTPVSLVIPTYNRGEILCQTMKMALSQDYPDFEVIVVDQTLDPPEQVRLFIEAAGERLRYIRREAPNLPAARNAGVRIARGEIIVFIDDDVVIGPGYLASHVARYGDRSLGGLTGLTLTPTPGEVDEAETLRSRLGVSGMKERLNNGCFRTYSIEGCNCSFRKEAIIRAGMFDERFAGSAWGEDTDLALRVKHLGYLLVLDPEIRLVHLALESGGCRNRDAHNERVSHEHHRLFLYHVIKNHSIFGSARSLLILWRAYRACAMNRETLSSPLRFARSTWCYLRDLARAAWWAFEGPLVSPPETFADLV